MPHAFTSRLSKAVDLITGSAGTAPVAVKVPLQITAMFWAIKLTSTALGEALADWLDGNPNLLIAGLGGVIALVAFVAALRLQFRVDRYQPAVYWFAVAMVATFGTMAADALHQFLGAPYWSTTLFYAIVLAIVFRRWWVTERTLSIHSISTRSREKFYWATVLATFALGTAAGDWTARDLHLDYLPSALLFLAIIVIPAIGYRFGANPIAMFWFAYVLTRPLGASIADYLDTPHSDHGLAISRMLVWGSLALLMAALVAVQARTEGRQPAPAVGLTTVASREGA